jgi:predicted site-specific integrase-resolvase
MPSSEVITSILTTHKLQEVAYNGLQAAIKSGDRPKVIRNLFKVLRDEQVHHLIRWANNARREVLLDALANKDEDKNAENCVSNLEKLARGMENEQISKFIDDIGLLYPDPKRVQRFLEVISKNEATRVINNLTQKQVDKLDNLYNKGETEEEGSESKD